MLAGIIERTQSAALSTIVESETIMWTRRACISGMMATTAVTQSQAREPVNAKRPVIDGIDLPAGFNGLLAYARGGKMRHLRCVGASNLAADHAVSRETQFRWGSVTKWLTSVALLRLVEQRRLTLEASVSSLLPGFREDTGRQVALQNLLSNTSGIPDLLSRRLPSEPGLRSSTATSREMVARFGGGDLDFAPGIGWDYSALNWVIIAAIIERVTGEPYPVALRRLVLKPLNMTGAFIDAPDVPQPRLALSYD
ncbi:MAG: class A beta-lactamase-related serine hydrolase, partial [Alphaproteobacteria bacterium]